MKRLLTLATLTLCIGTIGLARDVVTLSNGDKLVGEIVVLDIKKGVLRIKFSDNNALSLRFSDIEMVRKDTAISQAPIPEPLKFGANSEEREEERVTYRPPEPSKREKEQVAEIDRRISSIDSSTYEVPKKSDSTTRWGLKAGANFASASLGTGSETPVSSRTGVALGIINDFSLTNSFSIQSELAYSQYGYSSSGSTLSYNTIEAQVLGKYGFLERKSFVRPFAMAGFAPAFRVSSRESSPGVDVDASSQSNTILLSGVIGGSVLFGSTDKTNIGLDLRYIFGLTDVSTTGVSAKNSTFYFGTTFLF